MAKRGGDDGGRAGRGVTGIDDVTTRAELGAALERLRVRSGLTLRDLAQRISERCDTPIGPSALGDWCRGTRLPQPSRSRAFACLLDVFGVETGPWLDALMRVRQRSGRRPGDGQVPYPGLRSFGREEADWFFGRDDLVRTTVDRLAQILADPGRPRLLWVVGPSGAGKSSLLHAGVCPGLETSGHVCLSMTPGARPLARLAQLLAAQGDGDAAGLENDLRRDATRWAAQAAARNGHATTVLVVDQFEELLRACDDEAERSTFLSTLRALAEPADGPGYAVVVGLRIDFYAETAARAELVPSLQDAQVIVGPMSVEQLTEVIVEPACRVGITLDQGLVALLLRDFVPRAAAGETHGPGALPLLAHALRETWDLAESDRMTAEDYLQVGGIARAVEASAERVHERLDERERALARQAFLWLVHVGDDGVATRRVVPVAEVGAPDVIGCFVDARLLTVGDGTVEIAHESLLEAWPRLASWIGEDREVLRTHHKISEAARAWVEADRDPSLLARGTRLDEMAARATATGCRVRLSDDEREFLATSRRRATDEATARRRQARLLRGLATVAALFALLAGAFGVTANDARRDAEAARDEALSRQLAVDALAMRSSDPTLATQLAIAGYALSPSVEARSAVLELSAAPTAERHLGGRGAATLSASGDGGLVAVGDSTGPAVRLVRPSGERFVTAGLIELDRPDVDIYGLALARDGRTLAVGDTGGRIQLWDVTDPGAPRPLGRPLAGPTNLISQLAISSDGTQLAAAGGEGTVARWQIVEPSRPRELTPLPVEPLGPPGSRGPSAGSNAAEVRTTTVAFSGDELMAVGDTGGHVGLWSTDRVPRRLADLRIGRSQVFDVGFSADGGILATASAGEGKVTVWDVSGRRPRPLRIPGSRFGSWVNTVAFSRDGAYLAAGSSDRDLRVWDVATWTRVLDLPHPAQVSKALFMPESSLLVSTAEDGVMRAWDLDRQRNPQVAGEVWSLVYSDDGATLAAFSDEETRIWDDAAARRPRPGAAVPSAGAPSGAGDMTADGGIVAIGTGDGPVELIDVADPDDPRPLGAPLTGLSDTVQSVAFSGDDRLLAAGSDDSSVAVWDLRDRARPRLVARLQEPTHKVWGVGWSPSGRLLAVTGEDDLVHLYDLQRPPPAQHVAVIEAMESDGYSVAFSPDGTTLAVGGSDGLVTLWDVTDPTDPSQVGKALTGTGAQVTQLTWDDSGRRLAAAVLDGTAWLWDLSEPEQPATVAALRTDTRLNAVTFRPGHDSLTGGGTNGTLHLWSTDADAVLEEACSRLGATITAEEWNRYLPGSRYAPPCAASG
jgi:YD repeat-containing protein